MRKLNVTGVVKGVRTTLSKHAPSILIGVGITGMWGATVLAVTATPKAVRLVEEEKLAQDVDRLKPLDLVKVCWKCYIPAVTTGAVATACIIGGVGVNARRSAALATAYKLSQNALSEYKNAVVETVGEKKERSIRDKLAENALKKEHIDEEDVIITGRGNTRCYDAVFGRCFRSSREVLERAMNEVNRRIVSGDMYASLNDFYDEIDLVHVDIGDLLGWNLDDGEIKLDFSSQLAHNGEPTLVIHYNVVPRYDFYKFV